MKKKILIAFYLCLLLRNHKMDNPLLDERDELTKINFCFISLHLFGYAYIFIK